MTELLHPARSESAAPPAPSVPGRTLPAAEAATGRRAAELQGGGHGREGLVPDDALSTADLEVLPTRQLRVMVNQAYKLIDTDYPPAGAAEQYAMIVDEIERRAQQASEERTVRDQKEIVRDNHLYSRFELYLDGTIAAYLKYAMNGGQIFLLDGVEQPGFRDQGIGTTLMRQVMLNAHKRRLSIIPQCPMAFSFLADNPQYQLLTAARPTL